MHLRDAKGRKVDIIHHLKLDRTYTGEQNLGAETHVDVEIEPPDLAVSSAEDCATTQSTMVCFVVSRLTAYCWQLFLIKILPSIADV